MGLLLLSIIIIQGKLSFFFFFGKMKKKKKMRPIYPEYKMAFSSNLCWYFLYLLSMEHTHKKKKIVEAVGDEGV